jgi:transcriptional regulator with AAA-type ATPase domain
MRIEDDTPRGAATTVSIESSTAACRVAPIPGVIMVFSGNRPAARVFRLDKGAVELGRVEVAHDGTIDEMISRRHVHLSLADHNVKVVDLASRNGTFVDGLRLTDQALVSTGSVIRFGGALLVVVADVLPFEHYGLGCKNGVVGGPTLRKTLESLARLQQLMPVSCVLITGESGTGKEVAANAFHAGGGSGNAPFSAVNCATIPKDLAERLLFGSRRGAFSGATDAPGYVQAAHGGTLFLDEIAELPTDVQSKLLRMLETREVLRLGATSPERVNLRLCAATWKNLRAEVTAGRFRDDLYFRIGQPEIRLPALRERSEEVPWHIQQVLDEFQQVGSHPNVQASASFVEACMLRQWPGNVREIRAEVRRAAVGVMGAMGQRAKALGADDLAAQAGRSLHPPSETSPQPRWPKDEVSDALISERGNVASAARRLGIHRNKIRRWLERNTVEARSFKTSYKPDST